MSKADNAALMPYGAFELKARYQRNLLMGEFLTVLVVAAVTGGILLYAALTAVEVKSEPEPMPISVIHIGPPQTIIKKPPIVTSTPVKPEVIAKGTKPIPVPDDQVKGPDGRVPSQEELRQAQPSLILDSIGNGSKYQIIDSPADNDYLPSAEEFVSHEIAPEMIYEAMPEFPRLAQLSHQEGAVWIKALVDKYGNVRQAMIYKSSGLKVGFDEAAIAAAYKCKYRPAIQNGQPIAVWVTYKVEFALTGRENR